MNPVRYVYPEPDQPDRPERPPRPVLVALVVALVVGAGAGAVTAGLVSRLDQPSDRIPGVALPTTTDDTDDADDSGPARGVTKVADALLPAVVSIEVRAAGRGSARPGATRSIRTHSRVSGRRARHVCLQRP